MPALVLGALLFGLLSLAALLAALWFAYTYMLWRMGWRVFAARYGTDLAPAQTFIAASATFGHVFATYKTTARAGFVPEGVVFTAALPLGVAHAPFLLPWERVRVAAIERGAYGERTRLELRDEAGRVIVLLPVAALATLEAQRTFQR